MKGIILAGGTGSRLYPLTLAVNKQLLPVYDKPMIYYPICTLFSAGIAEILIIAGSRELELYQKLLGTGAQWGVHFSYALQERPEGIAQALIIAEAFLHAEHCLLILGDNLFFSAGLGAMLHSLKTKEQGATIFACRVTDARRYGVVEFNAAGKVLSLEEKPLQPKSQYAVTGLYQYDEQAVELAKSLKPSKRGELEITDLNNLYLKAGLLEVKQLERGSAWMDAGTPEALLDASDYVRIVESRQGIKIGSPEETAFKQGFISREQLLLLAKKLSHSEYGRYLTELAEDA